MTMITPSYLGETIEYSSLHACRSTLEDPTIKADERMWGKRAVIHNGPRQHPGAEVGYRVAVCPSLSIIQLRVAPTGKSI